MDAQQKYKLYGDLQICYSIEELMGESCMGQLRTMGYDVHKYVVKYPHNLRLRIRTTGISEIDLDYLGERGKICLTGKKHLFHNLERERERERESNR